MKVRHSWIRTHLRYLALALPFWVIPTAAVAEDVTLFDVDFNGPPHSLNETPEIGPTLHHISEMRFGSPTVVSEYGDLKERPLLFRGRAGYDQIGFQIPTGYAKYRIEYEAVTGNLKNSQFGFSIHLDTPQVRVFQLHGGNNRSYRFPFPEKELPHPQLWEDGKKSHYVIEVDLGRNEWRAWQDGVHLFTAPFNATQLQKVRFTLSSVYLGAAEDLSIVAAFDNLKITANDDFQPGPPSSLTLNGTGNPEGLVVSWPAVTLAGSYRIYRGESEEFGEARILGETSETAFTDTTVPYDRSHTYWVTSVRKNVESATATHASGVRKRIPPSGLTLSRGTRSDGIAASWISGTPTSPIRILRSESKAYDGASLLAEVSGSFYLDTTAVAGRTYHYWIMPAWMEVPPEAISQGSGQRAFPPVEGLVITLDETSGTFRLEWASVAGAGHYTVYRSNQAHFAGAVAIGKVGEGFFTDHPPLSGSEVHYWVIPGSPGTSDFAAVQGSRVSLPARPDLWGEDASGSLVGKGITNPSGAGQSLTMAARNKRSMFGKVGIGMLGSGDLRISLSAPAGNRHYKTAYYQTGNVTAAATTGRLTTPAGEEAPPLEAVVTTQRRNARTFAKTRSFALPIRGMSVVPGVGGDLLILRTTVLRR